MELIEALKHQGRPFEIPDCSRDALPQFFVEMGYKTGVEVGTYKGEFTINFCKSGLNIYTIDPWDSYSEADQTRQNALYEEAKRTLSPYTNCKIIRKTSMEAVESFVDSSLDFVYIDGNHEFRYIAEDLVEWTKKVRPGGIVSGDDYFFTQPNKGKQFWHVGYVLKAYVGAFGIDNWYLIGSKNPKPGEIRDRWRSWFFIKEK